MDLWAAEKSSLKSRVGGTPDLEALVSTCSSRCTHPIAKASLRTLAEAGWPTQQSLFDAGRAASPMCNVCLDQPGTFAHRLKACKATASMRDGKDWLSSGLGAEEEATSSILRCGIPARHGEQPSVPPFKEELVIGDAAESGCAYEEPSFSGVCGSDGSLIHPKPARAARAGWAVVQTDLDGRLVFGYKGTCPDRFPSSYRAELWGVFSMARRVTLPTTLLLDNQQVVRDYQRGRAFCCCGRRKAPELWRDIFALLDQAGGEGALTLKWVKGHATDKDVADGRTTEHERLVNRQADKLAGQGSQWANELCPTDDLVEAYSKTAAATKVLVHVAMNWPADTLEAVPFGPANQPKAKRATWPNWPDTLETAAQIKY